MSVNHPLSDTNYLCFFLSLTQIDTAITSIKKPTGIKLSSGLRKLRSRQPILPTNNTSAFIMYSDLLLIISNDHPWIITSYESSILKYHLCFLS